MTLASGTLLGPYEIREPIGAGPGEEVYRAVDGRLRRTVAVRVLPAALTSDPEARGSLEREARALAALTHPNVLAIHDLGRDGERSYLVTALAEGETLRERLARGPIAPRQAAGIGAQVALGLAAAHEKGIVHRDLTPEHVHLGKDGVARVLDFGLAHPARAVAPSAARVQDLDPRLGDPAVTIGTPAYMSPEQARGDEPDGRSDIFALGSLLYEMLAGTPPFHGAFAQQTMLSVLRDEPAPFPPGRAVPAGLERIVARCLEKGREARFQSARDLAFALETVSGLPARPQDASLAGARRRRLPGGRLLAGAALAAAGLGAGVLASRLRPPREEPRPTVLRPLTYSGAEGMVAASPDDRLLAFASSRTGDSRIWLQQLADGAESPLSAGPSDGMPAFSPNGDELLFFRGLNTHGTLYRIGVLGGEEHRIADDVAGGAAYLPPDGREIVYLRQLVDGPPVVYGVFVARRDGSRPREISRTTNDLLAWPRPSPDGQTIAVLAIPGTANRGSSYLLFPRSGGPPRRLPSPRSLGRLWAPSWSGNGDALVYAQVASVRYGGSRLFLHPLDGSGPRALLWAPFELRGVELLGGGRVVADTQLIRSGLREGPYTVSLPRITSGAGVDRQPVYSPDGRWLTFSSNRSGELEIWTLSLEDGRTRRLTQDPADDWDPGYTRDGRLLWSSGRSGTLEIWIAEADGSGARQVTRDGVDAENPTSTPDGWVVYRSGNPARPGIFKIREDGTHATFLVPDPVLCPEVSPDGRHVAYVVPALPGPEAILRVVRIDDGVHVPFEVRLPLRFGSDLVVGRPRWLPDGSGIAFVAMDETGRLGIVAQDFRPGVDTKATRRRLAGFLPEAETETFGLSPDGRRIALSALERRSELYSVEGLAGLPSRARPGKR